MADAARREAIDAAWRRGVDTYVCRLGRRWVVLLPFGCPTVFPTKRAAVEAARREAEFHGVAEGDDG